MVRNLVFQKEYYRMALNLPHRRLIVDDTFRVFKSSPQKRLYPSSGCWYVRCPFSESNRVTCNKCPYSYDYLDL